MGVHDLEVVERFFLFYILGLSWVPSVFYGASEKYVAFAMCKEVLSADV